MKSLANGKSDDHKTHYDRFYASREWTVNEKRKWETLQFIADAAAWRKEQPVLDLGCGTGIQTEAIHQMGYKAIGVDVSETGIARARQEHSGPKYIAADVSEWEPEQPLGAIFCRGMSWFHYELNGINRHGVNVPHEFARFYSWLLPGGSFTLQIATDFSGTDSDGGILNNTLDHYVNLFASLAVVSISDWTFQAIETGRSRGIIIVGKSSAL